MLDDLHLLDECTLKSARGCPSLSFPGDPIRCFEMPHRCAVFHPAQSSIALHQSSFYSERRSKNLRKGRQGHRAGASDHRCGRIPLPSRHPPLSPGNTRVRISLRLTFALFFPHAPHSAEAAGGRPSGMTRTHSKSQIPVYSPSSRHDERPNTVRCSLRLSARGPVGLAVVTTDCRLYRSTGGNLWQRL